MTPQNPPFTPPHQDKPANVVSNRLMSYAAPSTPRRTAASARPALFRAAVVHPELPRQRLAPAESAQHAAHAGLIGFSRVAAISAIGRVRPPQWDAPAVSEGARSMEFAERARYLFIVTNHDGRRMGRYKDYREPKRRGYNDDYTPQDPVAERRPSSPRPSKPQASEQRRRGLLRFF